MATYKKERNNGDKNNWGSEITPVYRKWLSEDSESAIETEATLEEKTWTV